MSNQIAPAPDLSLQTAGPERRVASSFLAQLLFFVATVANRVVLMALLLRAWGADQLSVWVIGLSVAAFAGLPDSWMQLLFGNLFHRCYAVGEFARLNRWIGVSLSLYGIVYTLVLALLAVVDHFVDLPKFLNLAADAQDAGWVIVLLVADRCVVSLRGSVVQLYRAAGDLTRLINSGTLLALTSTLCVATAVLMGATPVIAAAVMLASDILFGLGWLLFDLKRRFAWLSVRPALPFLDDLHQIGANIAWYAIDQSGFILLNDLPVILLAAASVDQRLIISFVLMRTVINLVRQVQAAAANSFAFEVADRAYNEGTLEPAEPMLRMASFVALVCGLLAGIVMPHAQTLLAVWSGKANLFDPLVFALLMAGLLATGPSSVTAKTLSYMNRPATGAATRIIQVVLLIIGSAVAVQVGGFLAIVVVLSGAEIVAQAIALPLLLRSTAFHISAVAYAKLYGRQLAVFLVVTAVGLLINRIIPLRGWSGLLINGGMTGFAALLLGYVAATGAERKHFDTAMAHVAKRG